MNAAEIGVTVKDGIVTLTGTVDDYFKKTEAENAAKNVAGIKAVVEKIEVKHAGSWAEKDDNEIATEIVNALNYNRRIPINIIKVKVEKGWVSLGGEVPWYYQKEAAKNAVKNLSGVVGVSSNITIKNETLDQIEKRT